MDSKQNDELINDFIKSANEVTYKVNFCNKLTSDTISKNNQLKLEFENNKFNQNLANKQLEDKITTGLREVNEVNEKTTCAVDENLIRNKKAKVQYIIAILIKSKLVDNKEQATLEMHYDFNHEDIMNELESFYAIENESTISTE